MSSNPSTKKSEIATIVDNGIEDICDQLIHAMAKIADDIETGKRPFLELTDEIQECQIQYEKLEKLMTGLHKNQYRSISLEIITKVKKHSERALKEAAALKVKAQEIEKYVTYIKDAVVLKDEGV